MNRMKSITMRPLSKIPFDNRSLRELPVDSSMIPSQRDVPNAVFALVEPTPVEVPHLIAYSKDVAENLLEVDIESGPFEQTSKTLAGCDKNFGRTAAHCYCGHQFGSFAGQLGDGATMYIGETVNSKGERYEMQFKGAGLTPFSRTADGRKVLRSSVREFLCSEHLHSLGIPTTRALSICTSDSTVVRDILYDGHPRRERCSVIIRVAETFLRFGSFETARPSDPQTGRSGPNFRKNDKIVKQLSDYVMKYFYPECKTPEEFILDVTKRTALLAALWQTTGFCHGVLNTDNMSILGKTLDYGPFGFMERFDPHFICNRSDDSGRYAYAEQPAICLWNCMKLVETLALAGNVLSSNGPAVQPFAKEVRETYWSNYRTKYRESMLAKLGIASPATATQEQMNKEDSLFEDLFRVMNETAADFTQVFRALAKCDLGTGVDALKQQFSAHIRPCLGSVAALRLVNRPRYEARQIKMLVELIQKGKAEEILSATGLTAKDIQEEAAREERFSKSTTWSEREKSNSDEALWVNWLKTYSEFPHVEKRVERMNQVNPRFVLRNHVAQRAISKAERGDFKELNRVLDLCTRPYADDDSLYVDPQDGFHYDAPSEEDDIGESCAVSCSS